MLPINWIGLIFNKYTAIALMAAFVFGAGVSCDHKHMAKKLEQQQQAMQAYVAEAEANVARINAENRKAREDAEASALELHRRTEVNTLLLTEEVKRYEELKRVYLSERTVWLHDRSTRPANKQEPNSGVAPKSEEGTGTAESHFTLEDLMTVVVANNVKHNACVDQYITLMNLYEDVRKSFDH